MIYNLLILITKITEITMLLASGKIKSFSKTENPIIFDAVRCSLGYLGIILNVEFECEVLCNFKHIEFGVKLENLFGTIDSHLESSEFFKINWYPHTEHAIISNASITQLVRKQLHYSCFFFVFKLNCI